MDGQLSEELLKKLEGLMSDIHKRISLEEEAKDLELLNEIIQRISNASTEAEKKEYLREKEEIETRILQRTRSANLLKTQETLSNPENLKRLANGLKELKKKNKN